MMQVNRVIGKTLKGGSIPAATGAQGVKYRKPKPTNPKPFRLRTDVCETFFRPQYILEESFNFFFFFSLISDVNYIVLGKKDS
jgi:hypothetical protein